MTNLKLVTWFLAWGAVCVACSSSDKKTSTVIDPHPATGQAGGGTGGSLMFTGGMGGGGTSGSGTSGYGGSSTAGAAGSSAGSGGTGQIPCARAMSYDSDCTAFDPTTPAYWDCPDIGAATQKQIDFNGTCWSVSIGAAPYALCCPAMMP